MRTCITHHHACDCREDAHAAETARLRTEIGRLRDERRGMAPTAVHFVPPLAAYDIHPKLMDEIRLAHRASSVDDWFNGRESGLRTAYRIVFGEDAP